MSVGKGNEVTSAPSSFAKFLVEQILPNQKDAAEEKKLIDLGCGNARDTLYFLGQGLDAYGIDSCKEIIFENQKKCFAIFPQEKERFFHFNITNLIHETLVIGLKFDIVYCRFLLHAINEEEASYLFDYFEQLRTGCMIALEFRTDKDPLYLNSKNKMNHIAKTDHFRRFLSFDKVCNIIKSRNYKIIYQIESDDLSRYVNDNPVLGRIIAIKDI